MLLFALVALLGLPPVSGLVAPDSLLWLDLPEGLEEAALRDAPVLVYVQALSCGPCRQLEREVFPSVRALLDRFVLVQLDFEDRESRLRVSTQVQSPAAWARELGAVATPSLILLGPDAAPLALATGYRSHDEIARFLAYVATGAYRTASLEVYMQQTKSGMPGAIPNGY